MPNIAAILKGELSRLARKEVRAETAALKKAVSAYRGEISALKRRSQALEQQVRDLTKQRAVTASVDEDTASAQLRRFSAKGLASQRRRLDISARECGLLIGASSQSIYNWEEGKTRPLRKHLPALAALRTLGKKQARELIAARRQAA